MGPDRRDEFLDGMIMACDRIGCVHRYHDGELASAEREAAEVHIQECAECRRELEELRALSSFIVSAAPAEPPSGFAVRYDRCRRTARDQGVLRLAGWLTAAAAGVLIGALFTRFAAGPEATAQPTVWQTVAVMTPGDLQDSDDPDLVVEWMADDLTFGQQW